MRLAPPAEGIFDPTDGKIVSPEDLVQILDNIVPSVARLQTRNGMHVGPTVSQDPAAFTARQLCHRRGRCWRVSRNRLLIIRIRQNAQSRPIATTSHVP